MVSGQLRSLQQILICSRFCMKPAFTCKALSRYPVSSSGVTTVSKYDARSHLFLVCCWKELECLRPGRSVWASVFSTGLRIFFLLLSTSIYWFLLEIQNDFWKGITSEFKLVTWHHSYRMANWPFVIRNVHLQFCYEFAFFNFQPLVVFSAWQFGSVGS